MRDQADIWNMRWLVTRHGFTQPTDWERYGAGDAIRNIMRAKLAVPVPMVQEKYDRWMASRHCGGSINRPTATKVKKDKVQTKRVSEINMGLKALNQIMLG